MASAILDWLLGRKLANREATGREAERVFSGVPGDGPRRAWLCRVRTRGGAHHPGRRGRGGSWRRLTPITWVILALLAILYFLLPSDHRGLPEQWRQLRCRQRQNLGRNGGAAGGVRADDRLHAERGRRHLGRRRRADLGAAVAAAATPCRYASASWPRSRWSTCAARRRAGSRSPSRPIFLSSHSASFWRAGALSGARSAQVQHAEAGDRAARRRAGCGDERPHALAGAARVRQWLHGHDRRRGGQQRRRRVPGTARAEARTAR